MQFIYPGKAFFRLIVLWIIKVSLDSNLIFANIEPMKKISLIAIVIISSVFGRVWFTEISIECGGPCNNLLLGADLSATDGFDPGIDVLFFIPPSGGYGYFTLEDSLYPDFEMLSSDFRHPTRDSMVWDFELGGGFNFLIHWDPFNLPDSGEFAIGPFDLDSLPELVVTEWTDMRSTDSLGIYIFGGRLVALGSPNSAITERELPVKSVIVAYPNPFNSGIRIETPFENDILEVIDIGGNIIDRLETGLDGRVEWQPERSIPSGVYLVRLKTGNIPPRKIFLLK